MGSEQVHVAQVLAGARIGGAENFYTRLVAGLTDVPGLQQVAFTRPHLNRLLELQSAGVPLQTFRFGGAFDKLDHYRYRRALRDAEPDVVLTYMNRASQLTPKGSYVLASRLGHYYDLKYHRHADYWIGITRGICDHLIAGGLPANRIFQIPNFADERTVAVADKEELGVPPNAPLLLSAGRLHRNKGFDVLLKAMKSIPEAHLLLAGAGPEGAALRHLCVSLDLRDRVSFLGWREDIGELMRCADVFICPSRHEGLGSIVVESWWHQVPIVATRSQGPGELITHEDSGLLTPVDDPDGLATAVNQLLREPASGRAMAKRAHRHYCQHYSSEIVLKRYSDFFHDVAGRGAAQAGGA